MNFAGADNPSQKEKRGIIIQKSKVKVRLRHTFIVEF